MKKLSIEQKAKAYDEVRKKIATRFGSNVAEEIFSQFEMSDDERIRKGLIGYFRAGKCENISSYHGISTNDILAWLEKQGDKDKLIQELGEYKVKYTQEVLEKHLKTINKDDERLRKTTIAFLKDFAEQGYENAVECIDWLEKQGEQKPTDEVEPKFRVGDWVVHDMSDGRKVIRQIVNMTMTNRCYVLDGEDFNIFYFDNLERDYHLWTIQDAKDGDVLAYNDGSLTIFRYRLSGLDAGLYMSHVLLTDKIEFKQTCAINNVHPATKEQRDTLIKAMHNAGYDFDFNKKELKKIEQKLACSEKGTNGNEGEIPNSAWSEGDEEILNLIIARLHSHPSVEAEEYGKDYHWFKSIKERVQPKQEWSAEDDKNLKRAIQQMDLLEEYINDGSFVTEVAKQSSLEVCRSVKSWLKSLRHQNRWKPSDKQMEALASALSLANNCGEEYAFDLRTLRDQLKKLRVE